MLSSNSGVDGTSPRTRTARPSVDIDLAGPGRWRDGPNTPYLAGAIAHDAPALRVTVTDERAGMTSAVLTWQEALALHMTVTKAVWALDPTHDFAMHDRQGGEPV